MIKVATSRQMQSIDKRAIEEYGIAGLALMESAGSHVVQFVQEKYGPLTGKKVAVIAGRGNNGGDGFVAARRLMNLGALVVTYLLAPPGEIAGDARVNLHILAKMGARIEEVGSDEAMSGLRHDLETCHIVVDAIFGTGLKSAVSGRYKEAIAAVNSSGKAIVAIDIPSGLQADTGEIPGYHVQAHATVTLCLPKLAHFLYPAAKFAGELRIADIGIPAAAVHQERIGVNLLEPSDIRTLFKERDPDSHKGDFGHLLVVAGSRRMSGAAIMASISALRAGTGLVTLALPSSIQGSAQASVHEIMTLPLSETDEGTIALSALDQVLSFIKSSKITAILVGPGLTTQPETAEFCIAALKEVRVPAAVDADAINCLAIKGGAIGGLKAPLAITPHPGEMGRLIGLSAAQILKTRIEVAREFAAKHSLGVALKGAHTVIADSSGEVFINPTGNPGMASAGVGDVLSGMLGGLLAQGLAPIDALKASVYLHGLAGDFAAAQNGQVSLIAGDIIGCIGKAFMQIGLDGRRGG